MARIAKRMPPISEGEIRVVSLSYVGRLDGNQLLTGTPTVTVVTTSDLALSNAAVSSTELIIESKSVAIGKAAQFKISGQQAGIVYRVLVSVDAASPTETFVDEFLFPCE